MHCHLEQYEFSYANLNNYKISIFVDLMRVQNRKFIIQHELNFSCFHSRF